MVAKELMINDWVYNGTNHPIKIKHNYGKSVRYDEGGYSHEVEEKLINPIPITQEILELNGFTKEQNATCLRFIVQGRAYRIIIIKSTDLDAMRITTYKQEESHDLGECDYSLVCGIPKYVHQLQQALRLCGLNDIADSIKI